MSYKDKNKIFFGLLHYVFSEQDNVDWAFKTSLIEFTGLNDKFSTKQYKKEDLTDSIISYVKSVKPYHAQFSNYIEKYSSNKEDVNTNISEKCSIEYNIRFDAVTSNVDDQNNLTDDKYVNTHMANRLYKTVTQDKDLIKDYLNCHFKGLTIDGSQMNIDKSGYDAFLYDTEMYDSPTLTNEYYIADFSEQNLKTEYKKSFVNIGKSTFKIDSEKIISKQHTKLFSFYKNTKSELFDYSLSNNILSIPSKIKKNEKLILEYSNETNFSWVFESLQFKESTNEYSTKKIVDKDIRIFDIPKCNIKGKLIVQIENENGTIITTNGYEVLDGKLHLYDSNVSVGWKVIITVIDYSLVYDKLYNWEDLYGKGNNLTTWGDYYSNYYNIQNLDGVGMLRPHYEKERPSELSASHILTTTLIKKELKDNLLDLYIYDFKGNYLTIPLYTYTKLLKDINIGDNEIILEYNPNFDLPKVIDDKLNSSKIFLNNEFISFSEYEIKENTLILKKIIRAIDGTYLTPQHKKEDLVYTYIPKSEHYYIIND